MMDYNSLLTQCDPEDKVNDPPAFLFSSEGWWKKAKQFSSTGTAVIVNVQFHHCWDWIEAAAY